MTETSRIDISRIERELAEMWKREEDDGGSDGAPVIRACSFNLIVLISDERTRSAIGTVLDELTLVHPGRTFLIDVGGGEDSLLEASVSARCSIPQPGGKQVCCEQIEMKGRRGETGMIPSIVTSLLVPDVPIVCYVADPDVVPADLFDDLVGVADHLVIDHMTGQTRMEWVAARLDRQERSGGPTIGDLSWDRTAVWRAAIADAFERNDGGSLLASLSGVSLHCAGRSGRASALLLLGWIGASLDWKTSGPAAGSGGKWRFVSGGQEMVVEITEENDFKGISRVSFMFGGVRKLVLMEGAGGQGIRIEEFQEGNVVRKSMIHSGPDNESDLLIRQMNLLETDPSYRQSLNFLLRSVA